MKFGLIGTAYWARTVHASGLAEHELVDFVGVWGRTPTNAELVAHEYGVRPYADFDELLEDVDAVAFAVPPDAQPNLALRAVGQGKHVLLEKPVALSTERAVELADAIHEAGVASAVFFTDLWAPGVSPQLATIRSDAGTWTEGRAELLVSALADDGPYSTSQWRHDLGPIWDLGPHAVAVLAAAFGPETAVSARPGKRGSVEGTIWYESGAKASWLLSLTAPAAEARQIYTFAESARQLRIERGGVDYVAAAFANAISAIATGVPHNSPPQIEPDVRIAVRVTAVLEAAVRSLSDGQRTLV